MQEAVKKVREYIKNKKWNEYLVILPTSELRDCFVRELLADEVEGMLYPNIYTFDSFIDEVLRRENIFSRVISNIGRHELMRKITPGYSYGVIENILSAVSEIKKAGITPDDLQEITGDEGFLSLAGMAGIYRQYTDELEKLGLKEAEDQYIEVLQLIKQDKASMLKNLDYFYADWFFDLAPMQEDILNAVAEKARESEFYFLTAGKADIKEFRREEKWLPSDKNHISCHIFTDSRTAQVIPRVEFFTAHGREGEVRGAVKIIKEHLSQGGDIKDIALICRYPEKYAPVLRRICDKADLPLALEVKRPLSTSLFANNITSLLKLRLHMEKGFPLSSLADISFIFPDLNLEKIPPDLKIKLPLDSLKEEMTDNIGKDAGYLFDVLEKLSLIPAEGTYQEIAAAVQSFLACLPLAQNILSFSEELNLKERFSLAGRDFRALEKFNELLEQMKKAGFIEDEKHSLSYFIYRLEIYMENTLYTFSPAQSKGLKVLPPGDMRGLNFPVVIVLGFDEENFPIKPESSWVVPDNERKKLNKKNNFYLATSHDIYQREKILFYLVLRGAKEKLYLIYPVCDEEGEELLPSFFADTVKKALPCELVWQRIEPWLSYEENLSMLAPFYAQEVAGYLEEEGMPEEFISFVTGNKAFKPEDNFVSKGALSSLADKYRSFVWSVTRLDSYIKCPLKYFFEKELELKKEEEARDAISPLSLGNLQHRVLCSFFTWWKKESYCELDEGEVKAKIYEEMEKEEVPLNLHPVLWEIEKAKLYDRLTFFIMNEIKRGDFRAEHMEWEFIFELLTEENEAMKIAGAVDRIDSLREEDRTVYSLYDYKNSKGSIPGRQAALDLASLQLPLYITAVQEKLEGEVKGAAYINLQEGKVDLVFVEEKWKTKILGSSSRIGELSAEEWNDWLWRAKNKAMEIRDNITQNGYFPALPHPAWKRTCDYCAYSSICFYR